MQCKSHAHQTVMLNCNFGVNWGIHISTRSFPRFVRCFVQVFTLFPSCRACWNNSSPMIPSFHSVKLTEGQPFFFSIAPNTTQHTKPNNTKPKDSPKRRETTVKRCETRNCHSQTLKCSPPGSSLKYFQVFSSKMQCFHPTPCIYHTSPSIPEKVASSGSGLVSPI